MQVPGDTRSQENFPFTSSASGGTQRLLPTPIKEKKPKTNGKLYCHLSEFTKRGKKIQHENMKSCFDQCILYPLALFSDISLVVFFNQFKRGLWFF